MLRKLSLIFAVLFLFPATGALAGTIFWGCGGSDSRWHNADNWYNGESGTLGWDMNHVPGEANTVNIGAGGRDRAYPLDLYNRALGTPKMTDPTVDANWYSSPSGGTYVGGCEFSTYGYIDPNLYHSLWINPGISFTTGNLTICMGSGGYGTVYLGAGGYIKSHSDLNLAKRGGTANLYVVNGAIVDVNGTLQAPLCPGNDGGSGSAQGYPAVARIWLDQNVMMTFYDVNIWHTSYTINNTNDPLNTGKTVTGDGKINLEDGSKLRLRRGSIPHPTTGLVAITRTCDTEWAQRKRWIDEHIAEGRITATCYGYSGLTNGQLIPGTWSRAVISGAEVATDPCIGRHYYEVSASMIDSHKAYNPVPAHLSTPKTFEGLSWAPGSLPGGPLMCHKVYYSSNQALVAARDASVLLATLAPAMTSLDPGVRRVYSATSYWAVDEVYSWCTSVGDIWSFRIDYGPAFNQLPADGSTNLFPEQTLMWTPGLGSTSTDIYFGTSFEDVNSRSAGVLTKVAGSSYNTGKLALNTTYYWAADANRAGAVIADPCGVRSFTTSAIIMEDTFSTYSNNAALKAVWSDYSAINGATTATKSITGYDDPHSMQVDYNCYGKFGDVSSVMTYRTDAHSIGVRIRGSASNESVQLSLGVYDGGMYYEKIIPVEDVNVKIASWQEARVAFSELSGLIPANIKKVFVRFGSRDNPGSTNAAGTVLVDTVAMYPRWCVASNVLPEDFTGDCFINLDDVGAMAASWLVTKTVPTAPIVAPSLYLPLDETDPCVYAADPVRGYRFTVNGSTPWKADGKKNGCYYIADTRSRLILNDDWYPPMNGTNESAKNIFAAAAAANKATIMFYWRYGRRGGESTDERGFYYQTCMYDPYINATRDNVLTGRPATRYSGKSQGFWFGHLCQPEGTASTAEIYVRPKVDPALRIDEWFHVAVVKDGPAGIGRIYENGELIFTRDSSAESANIMAYPLNGICSIGIGGGALQYNFSGSADCSVDEFYVYPAALKESEIKYILGSSESFFEGGADRLNLYDDDIINLKDYSNFADNYLDETLWP